jgi:hypothetical protein
MINWLYVRRERIAHMLFGLFLVIQCCAIVFRHAHRLSNGIIIVHNHPYNPFCKGPFQPNDHSSNELYWLAATANILYDNTPVFEFAFVVSQPHVTLTFQQPYLHPVALPFFCFLQRGPPSLGHFLVY